MELAKLSLTELKRLQSRVDAEIKRRTDSTRRDLLKKIQKMASDAGLTLGDVVPSTPSEEPRVRRRRVAKVAKPVTAKVAPKYRNPADTDQTWTGRGRKPQWVQEWLNQGKPIEGLLINA